MVEVINHARGNHKHTVLFTGFDEDIDLNLRHIAEQAVFVLATDCPDSTGGDQPENF